MNTEPSKLWEVWDLYLEGMIASGLYFGGKYILQETGNDFWNK